MKISMTIDSPIKESKEQRNTNTEEQNVAYDQFHFVTTRLHVNDYNRKNACVKMRFIN